MHGLAKQVDEELLESSKHQLGITRITSHWEYLLVQDWWLCMWRFKTRLAPAGSVAAHVADCSPGVRKVLKSEGEVEVMSPGVADHITRGILAPRRTRVSTSQIGGGVEGGGGSDL